jgi:hypothetical protein
MHQKIHYDIQRWENEGGGPAIYTWRANAAAQQRTIDMFLVAPASFRLRYLMVILGHARRKIVKWDCHAPSHRCVDRREQVTLPVNLPPPLRELLPKVVNLVRDEKGGVPFRVSNANPAGSRV